VHSTRTGLRIAIPLSIMLVATGCNSPGPAGPGGATAQPSTPSAVGGPASSAGSGVLAAASPSPAVSAATLDVSPAQVKIGAVVTSLAFETPRHLVDQTMFYNAPNVDPQQPTPVIPDGATKGAIVLSDMLRVTNNMDPTQLVPPDTAQIVIRHAAIRVATADTNQAVPYLGISMDMLLDGRPVSFGQSMVPMVAADAVTPGLYYGNNVRLTQRGMYQVFVRLSRNALLGSDQPQAAQFNVLVH
jgi:hypothetical protein